MRRSFSIVALWALSACSVPNEGVPPNQDGGGQGAGGTGAGGSVPSLAWGPCDAEGWPSTYPAPPADLVCADVLVPIDHEAPDGPQRTVRVAMQPALQRRGPSKAVFNLAGGPGSSAVALSGAVPLAMPRLRERFDLVHVDVRGTGASDHLGCPGGSPTTTDAWLACEAAHEATSRTTLGTVAAAHDIDLIRAAMGYERIHLRGTSYGTRLGLEIMRQHGDRVVAAVLDGVVPPDLDVMTTSITLFSVGVTQLAADCAADTECASLVPDLEAALETYREARQTEPRPIVVDGAPTHETEATFLNFLEGFVSRPRFRHRVPRAIADALQGEYDRWNDLMGEATGTSVTDAPTATGADVAWVPVVPNGWNTSYDPATALYAIIVCSEWFPNSGGVAALASTAAAQTWPALAMLELGRTCETWTSSFLEAPSRQAVSSNVSTLLLSGALDLTTPPAWAEHARQSLPGATHVVLPHTGHGTVWTPCGGRLAETFLLADGDATAVDTSCRDDIAAPTY